jgi:hypothetical protein
MNCDVGQLTVHSRRYRTHRELNPLRQALSAEPKASMPPLAPGVEPEHQLQTYLDRLTMYVGCDVAEQSLNPWELFKNNSAFWRLTRNHPELVEG